MKTVMMVVGGLVVLGVVGGVAYAAAGGGARKVKAADVVDQVKDQAQQLRTEEKKKSDAGKQQMDALLGGLLSFGKSSVDVANQAAMDKKNQENVLKVVQGGLGQLATALN